MATKFIENLFLNMKYVGKEPGESRADITVEQYIRRLELLNNDKAFTSLTFLKNTEAIVEKVNEKAVSTRSSYYSAIIIALSTVKSYKKLVETYKALALSVYEAQATDKKTHEKTEKQKESIVPMEDINKVKNDLFEEIKVLIPKKKITETEYNKYLQYIVLSLYTDIPPRRNQDYAYMVIRKVRPTEMDKEKNYFITSEKKFVFNKYKTASKYDTQEVDVPDELVGKLLAYMKRRPDIGSIKNAKAYVEVPLLINYDGTEPNKVNFITRVLNKVFGKNIGATALRHIFLSDKYAETEKEKEKDADAMSHSVAQQAEYIKY